MKKFRLATLALAGASMIVGAPQGEPSKPAEQTAKSDTQKGHKNKGQKNKKQQKQTQSQTPPQK